jgi:O6-methylguanine-DNA--protein-cysteine methyltransferase
MKRCCNCEVSRIEKLMRALEDYFGGEPVNFLVEINLKVAGFDAPVYQKLEVGKKEEVEGKIGFSMDLMQEDGDE